MDFGQTIFLARQKKGMTARALARHLGMSAVHLRAVEQGTRPPFPSAEVVATVARFLDLAEVPLVALAASQRGHFIMSVQGDQQADKVLARLALVTPGSLNYRDSDFWQAMAALLDGSEPG